MSTLLVATCVIVGGLSFLFFYWRSLREDYLSHKIFSSGFFIVFGIVLGAVAANYLSAYVSDTKIFYKHGTWFWGSLIGGSCGFLITKYKYKFRLNEALEAAVPGFIVWSMLGIALLLASRFNPSLIIMLVAFVLLLQFYYFIKARYRQFSWYKSGRIGFASLATLGIFFLLRTFIAIFFKSDMVSLVGKIDGILSSIVAFIVFVSLYNLSQAK